MPNLSIREMKEEDCRRIVDYFVDAGDDYLLGMGVKRHLIPDRQEWREKLVTQFHKPIEEKELFYVIWMFGQQPIGHSNVNEIQFGESALMHLHMWQGNHRRKGMGQALVKMSIARFFEALQLKKLACTPFAENDAPNRTLAKIGFTLVDSYETVPSPIAFHQPVHRYELTRDQAMQLSQ